MSVQMTSEYVFREVQIKTQQTVDVPAVKAAIFCCATSTSAAVSTNIRGSIVSNNLKNRPEKVVSSYLKSKKTQGNRPDTPGPLVLRVGVLNGLAV